MKDRQGALVVSSGIREKVWILAIGIAVVTPWTYFLDARVYGFLSKLQLSAATNAFTAHNSTAPVMLYLNDGQGSRYKISLRRYRVATASSLHAAELLISKALYVFANAPAEKIPRWSERVVRAIVCENPALGFPDAEFPPSEFRSVVDDPERSLHRQNEIRCEPQK